MALQIASVELGKIVRSESHVRYTCQIYGQGETATPPQPSDFAFGTFVRMPLRLQPARQGRSSAWAVGLIYDTILVNPAFGSLGPRLSSDEQVTLFSPDYVNECAVLVSILVLGMMTQQPDGALSVAHGVPPVAPDLGALVSPLDDDAVRAFHRFADSGPPGGAQPYLHMGYLPHAIALDHPLLPLAVLQTVERLERLCPENRALLAIVKRNLAWRLKVEAAG